MTDDKTYAAEAIPLHKPPQRSTDCSGGSAVRREETAFAVLEVAGETSAASVPQAQPIGKMEDPIRALFLSMRQLAREEQVLRVNYAKIFSRQAVFMQAFADDFTGNAPFSAYYPQYQHMNYAQLRTYFTWRTKVREGTVEAASAAYAYIYMYELLSNAGVSSPQEGLGRLVSFWRAFRQHDAAIDRNFYRWVKDYHVYYGLPADFRTFACREGISGQYPHVFASDVSKEDAFTLFCGVSKYAAAQSVFYNGEYGRLFSDGFYFVLCRLREGCSAAGFSFDELVFQEVSEYCWTPFGQALFYTESVCGDRELQLSSWEQYRCIDGQWYCKSRYTLESGRQLIGYILKQTEALLRQLTGFKHKLSASVRMVDRGTLDTFAAAGIPLEKTVADAVSAFYREATRKVISVSPEALLRIREEALSTQDKLLVEEPGTEVPRPQPRAEVPGGTRPKEAVRTEAADPWARLFDALSPLEKEALTRILTGSGIDDFAREKGVMLEVLLDGINEKAFDAISDGILDFDGVVSVYEEYIEKLTEMVSSYA